ncbi:autotransporter outer membrane beta-barrel domain-containing protein, partial [Buttiauxella sp. A111]|uniref:autotransporter outer membrane beta-barrel domain-containing protein n=1 Tax=Buttiauxella sp. A111 TaxID=2563088 RepID=UPI00160B2B2C
MNKFFKVIWSTSLQCFVVTSELARNFGAVKSANSVVSNEVSRNTSSFKLSRSLLARLISSALVLHATSAFALDIQSYNPTDNDDLFGQHIISSGGQVLTNDASGKGFNALERGDAGLVKESIQHAVDDDRITSGSAGHGGQAFRLPSKESITYFDPITQTQVALPVYNSNDLTTTDIDSFYVYRPEAVGDKQYINMRIATVKSGGDLTVDIGSHGSDWESQAENQFNAIFKNGNVFDVEAGGTLNYNSKTHIDHISPGIGALDENGAIASISFNEITYQGKFNNYKGESVTVNNIDDLRVYNDAVIAAIQSGALAPTKYDAELAKAYSTALNVIGIKPEHPVEATDDILQPGYLTNSIFIHAAGADAKVNIAADASLQTENSDLTVIKVEDGAVLTNNGEIGVSSEFGRADAVGAINAVVMNNGVIDVGTTRALVTDELSRHPGRGVIAYGASDVTNNGIINVGGLGVYTSEMDGIDARDTTTVKNSGVINIATRPDGPGVTNLMYSTGIQLTGSASLIQDGEIYIGRKPMGSLTEAVDDLAVTMPAYGIRAQQNTRVQTLADSVITVGSKARNAVALSVSGKGVSLEQQGTINLNGVGDGSNVLQNIGVIAAGGAGSGENKLTNSGTVNINGANSVAFKLTSGSEFTNTGVININGGFDPVTKLANYGSWVEGTGSKYNASGTTNLNGDNAVAHHARNKGKIVITDSSSVNFNTGEKQIGYYAYGAGTMVERQGNANQEVATKDSTLYRIDTGARFMDTSGNTTNITASGVNSTAILATGAGTLLDSGDVQLNITGDGATAVKVEGGAKGILSAGSDIGEISGTGTTVGIVDGKYYGLDGTEVTSLKGNSVLTSYADLTSANTSGGASGYIARNGGKLDHQGTINFTSAGSTGVLVDSGILANSSSIKVNGTGVHIKGDSTVTNSGSASVHAVDGLAAYHVDSGSSLALTGTGITSAAGTAHGVLLDTGSTGLTVENATINMSATGSGNAIENKANIAGIALTKTRINVGNGIGVHTGASMAEQNSGTITVNGSGTGILFENINASTTTNKLDMSHSSELVINVTSAQGKGLVTNSSTDLDTGVSVNVNNASGGSAIIVNGTTKKINQSGVLTSKSTTSSVVDIDNGAVSSFKNSGTIQAASKDQNAVETLTGTGMSFTNQNSGKIVGHVNLMAGNNTVNLDAGSKGTDFTTDEGNDTFNLNNLGENTIGVFDHLVAGSGTDTLNITGSDYNLSSPESLSGFEKVNLVKGTTSGSNLTLDNTLMPLGDGQNDATGTGFNIDADSSLTLSHANDVVFASHLAGTGLMQVKLGTDKNFTFTSKNAADGFDGTVALSRANMELAGVNTQALSDATLRLDGYSTVHVGDGKQTIGGLKFNGGTLKFDSGTPGETVAKGSVHTTESMDLSGSGVVQVAKGSVSNDHPLADTLLDILAQDDATTMVQLAASDTTAIGGGGALILKDQNDNVISDSTTADIAQNGSTVAKGTYDYRLTSGDAADGLYISYGLTQVDLLTAGADALALNAAGLSGNAADLSAKITGTGDLAIDTGVGNTVSLSNTLNDYVGNTDIRSGTLKMIADNVLGQTDVLSLAA